MDERAERFVKLLVKHVRDRAIQNCDGILKSLERECHGLTAKRWRELLDSGPPEELIRTVIADSIDTSLFYFLHAVDEDLLPLHFEEGSLGRIGDGELAGFYMAEWRVRFTSERCIDDLNDI